MCAAPWSECCDTAFSQTDSLVLKVQSDHEFRVVVYNLSTGVVLLCFCGKLLLCYFSQAAPVLLLSSYHHSPLSVLSHLLYLRLLLVPTLTLAARGKLASLHHRLCTCRGKPISSSCPVNPGIICRLFIAWKFFFFFPWLKLGKERRGRLSWQYCPMSFCTDAKCKIAGSGSESCWPSF